MTPVHVVNIALILALAWRSHWPYVAPAAVIPAFLASMAWHRAHPAPAAWKGVMLLAGSLYAVFIAYPFVVRRGARAYRDPHLTAVVASAFFFVVARTAFAQGGLTSIVGLVPVGEAAVLALLLRDLLSLEAPGGRDLGRLALVAGAALAFVTVAIPLQLKHQWITIGWMLEGAALSWLYRRIPHRGLLWSALALMSVAFARLALNPAIFVYEPRGMRVFNWYLYAYLICGVTLFVAALVALEDRRSHRGPAARLVGAARRRRDPAVPAAEHRDRGLLRDRSRDHVPVRRDPRPGSDLHHRLADFRPRPPHRRHLPSQSRRPDDRRRADRGHDVQGVPVRYGIARRPVPGRVARRAGGFAVAGRARAAEVRAAGARARGRRRQRRRREDRPDFPRARSRSSRSRRWRRPRPPPGRRRRRRRFDSSGRSHPTARARAGWPSTCRSWPVSTGISAIFGSSTSTGARSRTCSCSSRRPSRCGNRRRFCRSPRPTSTS